MGGLTFISPQYTQHWNMSPYQSAGYKQKIWNAPAFLNTPKVPKMRVVNDAEIAMTPNISTLQNCRAFLKKIYFSR